MINVRDDIIIDIETLGTDSDAVIVSIGALIFNRSDAPGEYKSSFHVKLDIENQPGRRIEAGTTMWWMEEGMADARKAAFFGDKKEKIRLGLALKQLDDFIREHRPDMCWGNSPSFDMDILQHAYRQHRQEFPIKFWKWQDVRTVENFFYGKNTRKPGGENWKDGLAHDALDDCIMEISVLQNCWRAAYYVKMEG